MLGPGSIARSLIRFQSDFNAPRCHVKVRVEIDRLSSGSNYKESGFVGPIS
jgi:hypothetical protein